MTTPRAVRAAALAFALALTFAGGTRARADAVDDFQANAQLALGDVGAAAQEILDAGLDGNPDHLFTAVGAATDALVLQANLVTQTQTDPVKSALGKKAKAITLALAAFTRATAKAGTSLIKAQNAADVSSKTLKSLLTKLKAANKAGIASAARLKDLPKPGFILTEVGSSAGFHKPGSVAMFKLVQNPFGTPCAGPLTVTVTDQFGAPVTTDPHTFQVTDPSRPFPVTLGTAGGGSRVKIEGCGKSSERLLFNYGDFGKINATFRLQPKDLPHGSVSDFGLPYLEYVDAVGGTDPCVWTATGLPTGYTLQTVSAGHGITASTVGISGFPFANPGVVGTFNVTIKGVDKRGLITVRTYSLTIDP
jgi:hypothetical protein